MLWLYHLSLLGEHYSGSLMRDDTSELLKLADSCAKCACKFGSFFLPLDEFRKPSMPTSTLPDEVFALVIDTDQFAGSFEREMAAFCTGHVGECGVGESMAALFRAETML